MEEAATVKAEEQEVEGMLGENAELVFVIRWVIGAL